MVYVWYSPNSYPRTLIGECPGDRTDGRYLTYKKGILLPADFSVPEIFFQGSKEKLRSFDCLSYEFRVPLIGLRLKTFLQKHCPTDIQLFPVTVYARSEPLTGEYFLLNIIKTVSGVDRENSLYETIANSDTILSFSRIRYIEDCMTGCHLARDSQYLPHLLVSDTLQSAIKKEKFTGISLVRPQDLAGP